MSQEKQLLPSERNRFPHGAEVKGATLPIGYYGGVVDATPPTWAFRPRTKREIAILAIINQLTDKDGWESKVFDDVIATKWKGEALSYPGSMITEVTWDWV